MSQGIIYLITNKVNGHKYVSHSTLPMNKVWQQHIQESKKMSSHPLHKAFRKHGIDKFIIKQIDECDSSLFEEKERYWIEYYNSYGSEGYNDKPVKIQEPVIIKEEPKPTIKTKRDSWYTIKEEHRGNGKHSGVKIQGRNLDTGEIKVWDSIRDAAEEVTGDRSKNSNILVSARRNGRCYGYKWKLLEDKNKKKAVFSIHKKTESFGRRYESIADAIKELGDGSKGTGLIKSLKNPGRFSWKNYYWYYAN